MLTRSVRSACAVPGQSTRRLRPVETRVRYAGFVVDTKPDLQVGVVRPWLLVGSWDAAADPLTLRAHGCTHVLSLVPGALPELPDDLAAELERVIVALLDIPETKLLDGVLDPAFDFIDRCRAAGGVALVHCNAGCSRAPSVVIVSSALMNVPDSCAKRFIRYIRCAQMNLYSGSNTRAAQVNDKCFL
jgi:hypothetical protein